MKRRTIRLSGTRFTTLPLVREMDQTRLVLLSSGRWDGQSVGSVSNPETDVWQAYWGDETDAVLSEKKITEEVTAEQRWHGFRPLVGDLHTYPHVPHSSEIIAWLRILAGIQTGFLSEYGIGSLVNAIRIKGLYEQAGARPDLADYQLHKKCAEKYLADWEKYGIKDVYPDPEDLLLASERLHAEHRKLGYTALRSNPGICGYSLTGIIDQPCGEGLLTSWREPNKASSMP